MFESCARVGAKTFLPIFTAVGWKFPCDLECPLFILQYICHFTIFYLHDGLELYKSRKLCEAQRNKGIASDAKIKRYYQRLINFQCVRTVSLKFSYFSDGFISCRVPGANDYYLIPLSHKHLIRLKVI